MSKKSPLPFNAFRTGYNYDVDSVSRETGLDFSDSPSLAQQSFKDECDINTIVRRFGITGELPSDLNMPQSGDFTGFPDFHSAMNMVVKAQEEFMRLPADMRDRFANDPGRLMAFLDDPNNREEAVKLGLVASSVVPLPDVGTVVAPPSATPNAA